MNKVVVVLYKSVPCVVLQSSARAREVLSQSGLDYDKIKAETDDPGSADWELYEMFVS